MYRKLNLSKSRLEGLYQNQELSTRQIASIYKCDEKLVRIRMQSFGIPRRPNKTNSKFKITKRCKTCNRTFTSYICRNRIYCSCPCKQLDILKTHKGPWKDTNIEKAIETELIKNKIAFEKQKRINNKWSIDFFVKPNIIIECDGDYWHNRPETKAKDLVKDRELLKNGYKIYRLSEQEILKDPFGCIKSITELNI